MKNQRVKTTLRFYLLLAAFVAVACMLGRLCITPASAANTHNHTQKPFPETVKVSDWAKEEVSRAIELGFGPSSDEYRYLPDTLSAPAQWEWFGIYSSRLIALQQGCDEPSLTDTVLHYQAEKDAVETLEVRADKL